MHVFHVHKLKKNCIPINHKLSSDGFFPPYNQMVNIRGHSLNGKTVKKTAKKGFVMCHLTPFGHFQPFVWPCSCSHFDLEFSPSNYTKKSTRTEIMILECSVPLMRSCLSLFFCFQLSNAFLMECKLPQSKKERKIKKLNLNKKIISTCVYVCMRVFILCVSKCVCVCVREREREREREIERERE